VSGDVPPRVSHSDDVLSSLDRPGGMLLLRDTPLAQAAEEIARRFGRTVTVRDKDLRRMRNAAWFGEETPEAVTEVV